MASLGFAFGLAPGDVVAGVGGRWRAGRSRCATTRSSLPVTAAVEPEPWARRSHRRHRSCVPPTDSPVRAADLDHRDTFLGEVPGQCGAVGTGPLNPDRDHVTE